MSNAGLIIKNNSGKLIIDSTYKNLMLFRKEKLTSLSHNVSDISDGTWYLTTNGLNFWTAIASNEVVACIARSDGSALNAFCTRHAQNWVVVAPYTSSITTESALLDNLDDVYVYVFGVAAAGTGYRVGMQVFNEDGLCVYDSNNKYLRVMHYANNSKYTRAGNGTTLDGYTIPSGKIGAIFNCSSVRLGFGNNSHIAHLYYAYQGSGREVLQTYALTTHYPTGSWLFGNYIGYIVADVTDL